MSDIDYMDERDAYERAGELDMYGDILNPIERFRTKVHATCRGLNNHLSRQISEFTIEHIEDKIDSVPKPEYKNAECYVLGYLASNGGKNMNLDQINYVCNDVLPYIENDRKNPILKPDVIRYARLWMTI